MKGLKPSILDKVYALEKIPTDITGWYTQACQIDNQWHRVQEIKARNKGINLPKRQNHTTPRYTNTNMNTQDPNTMDVDCLTIEERTDHYKKGLCFNCHQPEHIGKECPNRIKKTTQNRPINFKKTGRSVYATIQSLASELDEEEKKSLTISSVLLARIGAQSMNIPLPILCESQRNKKTVETQTLIDSGAGGDFLHQDFATKHRIDLLPLDTLIIPWNIDGMLNIGGKITHYIYIDILFDDWRIGGKLLVTNIRKNDLILGLPCSKRTIPRLIGKLEEWSWQNWPTRNE